MYIDIVMRNIDFYESLILCDALVFYRNIFGLVGSFAH